MIDTLITALNRSSDFEFFKDSAPVKVLRKRVIKSYFVETARITFTVVFSSFT